MKYKKRETQCNEAGLGATDSKTCRHHLQWLLPVELPFLTQPRFSDLIGLGLGLGTVSFKCYSGGLNAEPELRTTALEVIKMKQS